MRGRCFIIWFPFSLSCSDLIGNKFKEYPQVEPFLTESGEGSLAVLISPHEPFVTFSLFCPAEEWSDRAGLVAPGV